MNQTNAAPMMARPAICGSWLRRRNKVVRHDCSELERPYGAGDEASGQKPCRDGDESYERNHSGLHDAKSA
jgi:hypothetical protein